MANNGCWPALIITFCFYFLDSKKDCIIILSLTNQLAVSEPAVVVSTQNSLYLKAASLHCCRYTLIGFRMLLCIELTDIDKTGRGHKF